jgi:hypothetical protein
MKIEIPINPPLIKIPPQIAMILYLLKEEIKSRSLMQCFDKAGFDTTVCGTNLSSLILSLTGFAERTDDLFEWYMERLEHYATKADVSDGRMLNEYAFSFYVDIEIKRRLSEECKSRIQS